VDVLFHYNLLILLVDMDYRIFSHFGEKQKDEPHTLRNLEIKTGTAKIEFQTNKQTEREWYNRRINRQTEKIGITDKPKDRKKHEHKYRKRQT
jgi:hypothetical protein